MASLSQSVICLMTNLLWHTCLSEYKGTGVYGADLFQRDGARMNIGGAGQKST